MNLVHSCDRLAKLETDFRPMNRVLGDLRQPKFEIELYISIQCVFSCVCGVCGRELIC